MEERNNLERWIIDMNRDYDPMQIWYEYERRNLELPDVSEEEYVCYVDEILDFLDL